jgi:hypothetical protein
MRWTNILKILRFPLASFIIHHSHLNIQCCITFVIEWCCLMHQEYINPASFCLNAYPKPAMWYSTLNFCSWQSVVWSNHTISLTLGHTLIIVLQAYIKSTILWDITPCSLLKVNWSFGGTWGVFQRTTHRYIPEDNTLHDHRCENLKSYKAYINFVGR